MDSSNEPPYVKNNKSGDVYQMLNVIKDRSEDDNASFNSHINFNEETEE